MVALTAAAKTAVEMTSLWKPQTGSHKDLEISHRTRDSHIPTADHCFVDEEEDGTGTSTKCYPCIRSVLLPMFPVAQGPMGEHDASG